MREFFKRRGVPAIIVSAEGAVVLILLVIVLVRAGTKGLSDKDSSDILAGNPEQKSFSFVAEVDDKNKGLLAESAVSADSSSADPDAELNGDIVPESGMLAFGETVTIDDNYTPLGGASAGADSEFIATIRSLIGSMSVEDKIAQLFIAAPEDFTGSARVSTAGSMTKAAVATYPVGGFVYSSANYWDDAQAGLLLSGIREMILERTGIPCFILVEGTDEDGENFVTLSLDESDAAIVEIISGKIQNIYYDDDELLSFYGFLSDSDDPDLRPVNIMLDCDQEDAVPALLSGADMLYVRNGFETIYTAVFDAVLNGDLPIETVDDALTRIYAYKLMTEE